jgi:IclR helix-turn-helix domain
MNRKRLKRIGGRPGVEAKPLGLAEEVRFIQRRAAEHDGRFVSLGQLVLFSTQTGDAWMLVPPIGLLPDSPVRGIPSRLTSRKPRPTSPSAGKVTTVLRATRSSTSIERPAASLQSLATLLPRSLNQARSENFKYVWLAFIYAYTRVLGRPPAEADLQRHFGVSPPSVHQMILTLERAGLIRRQPGVARSIEVLIAPESLPILR